MEALRGVYNILSTPFLPDGGLDETSLRRLTEAVIQAGVTGITVLGVAGEAQKLTDAERARVIDLVMEVNAGRVAIVVGTSRDGTLAAIEASLAARAAEAAGLMIAPPTFVQPGAGLIEHYRRIGATVGLPITLQDYPPANGVSISPAQMAELVSEVPEIVTIKLEDPPTAQRMAQTLALIGDRASIVGGAGGMYLLDELRHGSAGTMTGFGYPEVLVEICAAWRRGDQQEAARVYYRYLPLLAYEGQPKIGLAVRKEMLRRRGLIDHATVRRPGPSLDPGTLAGLDEALRVAGVGAKAGPAAMSS